MTLDEFIDSYDGDLEDTDKEIIRSRLTINVKGKYNAHDWIDLGALLRELKQRPQMTVVVYEYLAQETI